jgi:hypothetical protein
VAVMPVSTSKEKVRYGNTYYDDGWLQGHGIDIEPYLDTLERFESTGSWRETGLAAGTPICPL